MTRRVVLGQQNDGSYGLRVSAPGVDAFVGDGQDGGFTFNSDWADIAKIHQLGLGSFATTQTNVVWTSLGYAPFVEVRKYVGNVVLDDYWNSTNQWGADAFLFTADNLRINNPGGAAVTFLYIVYKIPVPSG